MTGNVNFTVRCVIYQKKHEIVYSNFVMLLYMYWSVLAVKFLSLDIEDSKQMI